MKNFAIIIIYNKKDGRSRLNKTLMSNTQTVICTSILTVCVWMFVL